jgi:hypothetical protein
MSTKKMRVEIFNNGDRYTITLEGTITRDKALRLFDLVELLGGMPSNNSDKKPSESQICKIDKVRLAAEKNFSVGWFSSKDLQVLYEKEFNEPIRLSTVSTYLARLSDRGYFIRKSISNKLHYRLMNPISDFQVQE